MYLRYPRLEARVLPPLASGHLGVIFSRGKPLMKVGRDEIYAALFGEIAKGGRK